MISDLDLIALQQVDLHIVSAPSFVKFWKARHFQVRLAEPVNGLHRVALLSKVALKTVQLDIGDKHRCIATAIATDQPILLASCYGFSDDPPRARAWEVTEALHAVRRPWMALGDWNLEEDGLSQLFVGDWLLLWTSLFRWELLSCLHVILEVAASTMDLRTASMPQKCFIEKGSRTISSSATLLSRASSCKATMLLSVWSSTDSVAAQCILAWSAGSQAQSGVVAWQKPK